MLEALLGWIFEVVLGVVGIVIAKLFGAENPADAAAAVIGLGFLAIGAAVVVWGH